MAKEKYIALSDLKKSVKEIYRTYLRTHPNECTYVRNALIDIVTNAEQNLPAHNIPPICPGDNVFFVEYSEAQKEYYVRTGEATAIEITGNDLVNIIDKDGISYPYGILAFANKADAEDESVERNLAEQCWEEDHNH